MKKTILVILLIVQSMATYSYSKFESDVKNQDLEEKLVLNVKGVITPSSVAPTEDGLYLTKGLGTYTNFGGIEISGNDVLNTIVVTGGQTVFEPVQTSFYETVDELDNNNNNNPVSSTAVFNMLNTLLDIGTSFPDLGFFTGGNVYNTSENWKTVLLDVSENDTVTYNLLSFTGANLITALNGSSVVDKVEAYVTNIDAVQSGLYIVPAGVDKVAISVHNDGVSSSYYVLNKSDAVSKTLIVSKTLVPISGSIFNTIKDACLEAGVGDVIYIHEGIYQEISINVPNGVSLIGVGEVIIKGEQDESESDVNISANSTIDMSYSGHLENLTITAKNMRYPIHADFGYSGKSKKTAVNCRFIHYGNSEVYDYRIANAQSTSGIFLAQSAWGGGTYAGETVDIKNCYFESPVRAFSTHNNVDFNTSYGASNVTLDSCEFVSHGLDLDGSNLGFTVPIFIQSLGSNANKCKVSITNSILNDFIVFVGNSTIDVYCDAENLRPIWNLAGSSFLFNNNIVNLENNIDWFPRLTKEMGAFKNLGTVTIPRGCAVKKNSYGVELMTSSDTESDFFGVALQEIEVGNAAIVKFKGYATRPYLNISTTTTEGQDVSIDATGAFELSSSFVVCKAADNQNILIK